MRMTSQPGSPIRHQVAISRKARPYKTQFLRKEEDEETTWSNGQTTGKEDTKNSQGDDNKKCKAAAMQLVGACECVWLSFH